MSLTITSKITTAEGFEVENAYGRVTVSDSYTGTSLVSELFLFATEKDFKEQKYALKVNINPFCSVEYDRATMGSDILDLAHDNLIASLADQGIIAVKTL